MATVSIIPDELLTNKIYLIRGQKVMLDYDLAALYGVETKTLKQAVKRNVARFPDDFVFEMTRKEQVLFKSQIKETTNDNHGGARYLNFCFTEPGIAMLSSVLKSERAIQVNIQIIRIFIKIRHLLADHTEIRLEIEKIKKELSNQGKNMEVIFQYLDELSDKVDQPKQETTPRTRIGFKPDHY